MTRRLLALGPLLFATAAAAAGAEFSLRLGDLRLGPSLDVRTQARLAGWDTPMGRLEYFVDEQYANLLRGGQPGATGALAFRVKAQSGLPLELVASAVEDGVETSRTRVAGIPWPWGEDTGGGERSIERELATELGQRLTLRRR